MQERIQLLKEKLDLQPHPEGGFYKETYRSEGIIENQALPESYQGDRNYSTCIYFMLISGNFSAFHRIHQDEIWHFYEGSPVELHTLSEQGEHKQHIIGSDVLEGEVPQLVVPGGHWFASKVIHPDHYSLVGCTVSPGFDFSDFELAVRSELTKTFPQHSGLIDAFTH